jgi:hypothetical protein
VSERLADLDELVLRCRSKAAKEYIREAVACYRAGAFRSCIIATWNAIVYDLIDKLRELELTGNGTAKSKLQNFEVIHSNGDWKKLWEFETAIPELMYKEFALISPVELKDIERLHEDRNRCAHPSMQSLEEPFQVTAELARYHLRSALTHVLQHPPVQGANAQGLIFSTIKSQFFPLELDDAIEALKNVLLDRARESLVKNVVIGLTKAFLQDTQISGAEKNRIATALNAISKMRPEVFEDAIQSKIAGILNQISDHEWKNVLYFIYRVRTWHLLNEANQTKIKKVVDSLNNPRENFNQIVLALSIAPETREIILSKVEKFEAQELENIVEVIRDRNLEVNKSRFPEESIRPFVDKYREYAVQGFVNARSFDLAGAYSNDLILVANWLSAEHMKTVVDAFIGNDQIHGANRVVPENVTELFKQRTDLVDALQSEWLEVRRKTDGRSVYREFNSLIDQKFPNSSLLDSDEEV